MWSRGPRAEDREMVLMLTKQLSDSTRQVLTQTATIQALTAELRECTTLINKQAELLRRWERERQEVQP